MVTERKATTEPLGESRRCSTPLSETVIELLEEVVGPPVALESLKNKTPEVRAT
jgi:hypothetical protein